MPSQTTAHFQAHIDDGGQLCIYFPYSKFTYKSYAITHPLNLWKVLDLRKKYCKQEQAAQIYDKTNGTLSTFDAKYNDPKHPTLMDVWMRCQPTSKMFLDIQEQMFQYCDAGLYPVQGYHPKRWTQLASGAVMYLADHHMALDGAALRTYGPRYRHDDDTYICDENNVALMPVLMALMLYINKEGDRRINMGFCRDDYGGKTFVLEVLDRALDRAYPDYLEARTNVFQRILEHMKGTLPTHDSYRDTLKRVIKHFHDAVPAPLEEQLSDGELEAATLVDADAQ